MDPEAQLHVVVKGAEGQPAGEAEGTAGTEGQSEPTGPEELVVAAQDQIVVSKREPSGPRVQRNPVVDQRRL